MMSTSFRPRQNDLQHQSNVKHHHPHPHPHQRSRSHRVSFLSLISRSWNDINIIMKSYNQQVIDSLRKILVWFFFKWSRKFFHLAREITYGQNFTAYFKSFLHYSWTAESFIIFTWLVSLLAWLISLLVWLVRLLAWLVRLLTLAWLISWSSTSIKICLVNICLLKSILCFGHPRAAISSDT